MLMAQVQVRLQRAKFIPDYKKYYRFLEACRQNTKSEQNCI